MNTHEAEVAIRQMANIYRVLKDAEEVLATLGKAAGTSAELEEAISNQRKNLAALEAQSTAAIDEFRAEEERRALAIDDLAGRSAALIDEHHQLEALHKASMAAITVKEVAARDLKIGEMQAVEEELSNNIEQLEQKRGEVAEALADMRAKFG